MTHNLTAAIVIPVRLASTRLPQKPLVDIHGKPMIWHVYHRCLQVKNAQMVHVATDTPEIAQLVQSWGGTAWLTDPNCASGTERIVSIIDKLEYDIIVNVQGDEALLEPAAVDQLIQAFMDKHPMPDVVTPACQIAEEDIFNPNVVKMVLTHDGYALYFSRHPIPYVRDAQSQTEWKDKTTFWGHIGMYGYRRAVLQDYANLPPSPLEQMEKLEQLRFLQAGKKIFTFPTQFNHISVDTPEDLAKVKAILAH